MPVQKYIQKLVKHPRFFEKIMNGFLFLTILAKSSILDVWRDSEFASEASKRLAEKAPSQLTGF